jgi:hypothetical protein
MRRVRLLYGSVFSIALTFGAIPAAAQPAPARPDTAKRLAIRRLLAVQRTDSLMLAGVEQAFASETPNADMPPGFLDSLRSRVRQNVGQFVERLVPVYDSLYSASDIDDLLKFFQTGAGKRFLEAQPRLMEAMASLGQRWGMELAGQVLVDLSRQPPKRP